MFSTASGYMGYPPTFFRTRYHSEFNPHMRHFPVHSEAKEIKQNQGIIICLK